MGQYVIYSYQDKYHAGYFPGPEFHDRNLPEYAAYIFDPECNYHSKNEHRKPGANAIETGEENR
jgi:hypothetical protein